MKHRLTLSAALAAVVLSLAACAPNQEEDVTPGASPDATAQPGAVTAVDPAEALADMEWIDNGDGEAPELEADTPVEFTATGARLVTDGDGEEISEGQMLALDYIIVSGIDGEVQYSTYETGMPEQVQYIDGQIDPVIAEVLDGAHVGVDFLYAVPGDGTGGSIMVVTVTGVSNVLDRAEGAAVPPVEGLPVVVLAEDGAPSLEYPNGATMPEELVAQDLITGEGPVVEEGQSVTVHYTGWVYDGEVFDSSWERGAPATFPLTSGSLIEGWVQGLVGKTVGSQVLLVIPPELGYGESGSGEAIPPNSTLVFVVDILAAS
ncbi:FKBP-type peptidyl-prolyl cis-trans isomerase [Demequina sp. TTPB684]|uniref:FKBP-type peptidyl-prolyl cis-trans isomerase n=1 Tax=Demequina sp. TMPB413 TaxID=2881056 RepID=UPI001CF5078D|nr:FKBP-type peptidyl-prolyl cis-trans isomerase [Demequina sp. TMPB413]MCB2412435.1 FKBP-type peptidyl-prolyl cis-trans isomerase [Demequina sp. TTPB684]UPU87409.1 FKBP-type peptidyl-prolyl cis-trans isomerase [Demequina sp. TMPB413]